MKHPLIVIALAATTINGIAQDLKDWDPAHRPEWRDFKGFVPQRPMHDAYSAYQIVANYSVNEEGSVDWSVECAFDRDRSWAKDEVRGSKVLIAHERLHFDIAEVHARRLRQRLAEGAVPVASQGQYALKAVLDSTMAQCRRDQDRYDIETDHGRDPEAGARWVLEVQKRLGDLSRFAVLRSQRSGR